MTKTLNEYVDVIAKFQGNVEEVIPYKFKWEGRWHEVKKFNVFKCNFLGRRIITFRASDGEFDFDLEFNPLNRKWILEKIWQTA